MYTGTLTYRSRLRVTRANNSSFRNEYRARRIHRCLHGTGVPQQNSSNRICLLGNAACLENCITLCQIICTLSQVNLKQCLLKEICESNSNAYGYSSIASGANDSMSCTNTFTGVVSVSFKPAAAPSASSTGCEVSTGAYMQRVSHKIV